MSFLLEFHSFTIIVKENNVLKTKRLYTEAITAEDKLHLIRYWLFWEASWTTASV